MTTKRDVVAVANLSDESPAVTCDRVFETTGDGERYLLRLVDVPIELELDRTRRDHGELIGQLTARTGLSGARTFQGTLSVGTLNLSSHTARSTRAKQLAELSRAPQIDWLRLLEELAIRVVNAERAGGPAVDLRTFQPASESDSIDVHGVRLFDRHPIIGFGDGGAAKSLLALYFAGTIAQQGLRVGYCDWELTGEDHRTRLGALFGADMPEILYLRCARPMTSEAERITRLVREHKIDYLICDSISFACDGRPEDAEVAARYFQALRQIGIGSFNVAHVNKSEDGDQKPFGSAFWHNGARGTWNFKLSSTNEGGREITVGLYNRKTNIGAKLPAVALRITFDADRTRVAPISMATVEDLAAKLPLRDPRDPSEKGEEGSHERCRGHPVQFVKISAVSHAVT